MRYPSNSGVLWKVVFAFLDIIDTEQTAQIRWNTTGLRCLCLQFHSSRIPAVGHLPSVTMYNPVPIFLTDPAWQSRISPTVPMLSPTGRPHGYAWCGGSPWGSRPGPGHRCAARSQLLSSIYILQLLSFVTGDGGCACPSSSAVCLFSAMAAKICSRRCWGFLENAGAAGSCAGWRNVLYPLIKETQM